MAALFKVSSYNKPEERKIVKAASIDTLIAGVKTKLKLGECQYQVYTDYFFEIDEDDILMDLAKAKETHGQQLSLTIVPNEVDWNPKSAQQYSLAQTNEILPENVPTRPPIVPQAAADNSSSQSVSSLQPADHLSKIYYKFPTNIQTALRKGDHLKPRERTLVVHTVRDYIIYDLRDLSLGIAGTISNQLISKYQESFTSKIGSTDGEIQSLQQAAYSAVRYQKKNQAGDSSKITDSLHDNDELVEKPKMQDEYGCVAYLPASPSSEELELNV